MFNRLKLAVAGFLTVALMSIQIAAAPERRVVVGDLSLSYSADFKPTRSPESLGYIPVCDTPFEACLYYAGGAFKRPNFVAAAVRVHMATNATRASCVSPTADEITERDSRIVVHEGSSYITRVARDFHPDVNGLGHFASGELYRILAGDYCYTIEARWTYNAFSPPSFTKADEAAIASIIRPIVDSARLNNQKVTW